MKNVLIYLFILICILSCSEKKAEPTPTQSPTASLEFIATDSTFKDFKQWKVVIVQDSALFGSDGRAHTNAPRITWVKGSETAKGANSQYSTGALFVKSVGGGYGIVAMAKRNGDFNKDNQGWEWFKLDEEGKIKVRHISPNGCDNCHAKVKSNQDYVFSIP